MTKKKNKQNLTIMDDEIPEIPDILPDILDAAAYGKLIIFIGAGVSKIVGCPLWQEFANLMLDDLYKKECINYYEYENLKVNKDSRKLLSICKKIYQEKKIELLDFETIFYGDEDKKIEYGAIYKDLYAFNSIYITTNYDIFLDQVLIDIQNSDKLTQKNKHSLNSNNLKNPSKIIYEKSELLTSNLNYKNIIHLHGCVKNPKTMIISITDYLEHYAKGSEVSYFLEDLFQNFTVLFIGFGLDEYEIMEFLLNKVKHGKKELRHFMLYPIFKSAKNLLKFQDDYYATLSVKLIPFQIDKRGHNQLALIINQWSKQIGPKAKPQHFLERIRLIDEVIK